MTDDPAFETYQRSLECLTMIDEPPWTRIRHAFAAGRAAERDDRCTCSIHRPPAAEPGLADAARAAEASLARTMA